MIFIKKGFLHSDPDLSTLSRKKHNTKLSLPCLIENRRKRSMVIEFFAHPNLFATWNLSARSRSWIGMTLNAVIIIKGTVKSNQQITINQLQSACHVLQSVASRCESNRVSCGHPSATQQYVMHWQHSIAHCNCYLNRSELFLVIFDSIITEKKVFLAVQCW